ncbi:hypothetical protein [Pseudonocardia spinosispora]|uniref:hypothetical protein n=1 Tax=Pseudonocardia spinosispora TaxID=103441 RepID=UPI00048A56E8|nr:hypothetical protein [Pseudonocardia spinosispora]
MMMVEMLAQMPDLRRRILADHVADSTGHCRDCARAIFPCEVFLMASEADRRSGVPAWAGPPQQADRRQAPPQAPPMARRPVPPMPRQPRQPMRATMQAPTQLPAQLPMQPAPRGSAQLPPQRRAAYPPAPPAPNDGPAMLSASSRGRSWTARRHELDLPSPRETPLESSSAPRHLMGHRRPPAPKQELIDVLEDVLRWSR